MFTGRLTNLRQDIAIRQDTSGDKFTIELDGQETNNRGIAGELILRRAEKLKNRFGDDVRIGRFAGFDLFLRPPGPDLIPKSADAEVRGWKASEEKNGWYLDQLKQKGMTIVKPAPQLTTDLKKVGDTMLQDWLKKAGPEGQSTVDAYRKM